MAATLWTRPMRLAPWLLVGIFACTSAPVQEPPETEDTTFDSNVADSIVFRGGDNGALDGGGGGDGILWLTIAVDDTANETFANEEIKWTGSFSWDDKTNTIVYADSWLPTDGPYPYLWDDGPLSSGGHEQEGATKGDHIFSTAVKFVAAEDTTLQYGLLNEFDNWMWVGPNGSLEIKKGASGVLSAKGMTIAKHGDVDMKVTLDTSKLEAKFKTWADASHKFFIKGTMNMWTPRQLLDDGGKGDTAAGDGIYTYVQSQSLGSHDGLLNAGDEVQFVWVATQGDTPPEAGKEYKSGTSAHAEGVSAWTNTDVGGTWQSVPVVLALDSKGKVKNTAIVVPGGGGCDPACTDGHVCEAGKCVPKTTDPCGGLCKDDEQCTDGKCVPKTTDPCGGTCKDDEQCTDGKCVPKTVDPCGGSCGAKQACVEGKCVDTLWLDKVEPAKGELIGGTKVDVTGGGFLASATVRFGGKDATCTFQDSKTLQCVTPAGDKSGAVAVEVQQGGEKVNKETAFTYDPPPVPQALLLEPLAIAASAGEAIMGAMGRVRVAGITTEPGQNKEVTVEFGIGPAATKPADPSWKWQPGTFIEEDQFGKGEETYGADFPAQPLGDHLFAIRATYAGQTVYGDSDGSENGLDVAKLGSVKVKTLDTTPKLTGLDPVWASIKGGTPMVVVGKNLKKDFKIEIKSLLPWLVAATDVAEVASGLSFTMPPAPTGVVVWPPKIASVVVTPPGAPALTLEDALHFVPIHTPAVDGKVAVEEWTMGTWMGINKATQVVDPWKGNSVGQIFAAYDKDNLYIGVEADCEPLNAIVVYIDVDYGAKTGAAAPVGLKDNANADNSVDDALSSALEVAPGGFGIDFGFATVGMKSFLGKTLADSKEAGWRGMKDVANFDWLLGEVLSQPGSGVEASIPLATLFPNGVPAAGTQVAFFAAVVNKDGSLVAPGAISPNLTDVDYGKTAKEFGIFYMFPQK